MDRKIKIEELLHKMTLDEKINLCTGKNSWQTLEIEHLGIPSITMSDGTNGVRFQKGSVGGEKKTFYEMIRGSFDSEEAIDNTYPATCFPTGSAIACSWDRELIGEVGQAIARECKALGIDLLLGPGINTRRHPLTARNYEYYSEDPYLAGEMAAGMIEAVQQEGVGTSIKHFACHNSDSFRTRVNVNVSERALREIYLACFERAIKKAHPLTVMSAYNQVNGVEASGDTPLVKEILKKEWKYDGAVICDWGAIKNPIEATRGGIDLQMPHCKSSAKRLKNAIEQGELEEALVDERVRRILNLVLQLKEMKQEPKPVNFSAHHGLAVKAAKESAVLLKNENHILPLHADGPELKKIAVLGLLAKEPVYQGSGCAVVHAVSVEEPLACMQVHCQNKVDLVYAQGYDSKGEITEEGLKEGVAAAKDADIVVVFAGNMCPGETDDYNRKHIRIEEGHRRLIEAASQVNPNVVVILASGEVLEMPWISNTKAVLHMWYTGEGAGMAFADLLFGAANPCGKLSATVPVKLSDTPSYLGFTDQLFDIDYSEDIFVGYRYYDKKELRPEFPFGYGLSYTDFQYTDLTLSTNEVENPGNLSQVTATVKITNIGHRPGKEIVQLYIAQQNLRCKRPVRELKGFQKVFLNPGESKTVIFYLEERDFSYYNEEVGSFVVDAAVFTVEAAASSRDIRLSSEMKVKNSNCPLLKLRMDCGFTELFEEPEDMEAFDRFLERNGVMKPEQIDEHVHQLMKNSFWAVSSYLDMNAGDEITWEKIAEFMVQRNQRRS